MTGLGLRTKRQRTCRQCGTSYETTKATSRFCSDLCRKTASRLEHKPAGRVMVMDR